MLRQSDKQVQKELETTIQRIHRLRLSNQAARRKISTCELQIHRELLRQASSFSAGSQSAAQAILSHAQHRNAHAQKLDAQLLDTQPLNAQQSDAQQLDAQQLDADTQTIKTSTSEKSARIRSALGTPIQYDASCGDHDNYGPENVPKPELEFAIIAVGRTAINLKTSDLHQLTQGIKIRSAMRAFKMHAHGARSVDCIGAGAWK
eukprot:jgi/Ulvmu1/12891/UM098_0079.1